MPEPKTKQTEASVADFIQGIEPDGKRRDSAELVELMQGITGQKPRMWGGSIVGFGTYTITTGGKAAEWPLVGFSPRKANLTLYITPGFSRYEAILEKLGKHSTGKSCLYIKTLADIDLAALKELVRASVDHMRATYPTP